MLRTNILCTGYKLSMNTMYTYTIVKCKSNDFSFRNVVKSYYTAGMLFDVLSTFGDLSDDVSFVTMSTVEPKSHRPTFHQDCKLCILFLQLLLLRLCFGMFIIIQN